MPVPDQLIEKMSKVRAALYQAGFTLIESRRSISSAPTRSWNYYSYQRNNQYINIFINCFGKDYSDNFVHHWEAGKDQIETDLDYIIAKIPTI